MILGAIALVAFLILSLRQPRVAYGLILALLPAYLYRLDIGIPTTGLELIVGVFLLAVLLTHYDEQSWKRIKGLGRVNFAILALLLAAVVSTLVSPEPVKALGQLKAFFVEPMLMFYASVLVFRSKKDLAVPLRMLFASAALISAFGIFQYWTHVYLPLRFWGYGVEVKRITSIFEYPNALALYLAPLFALFLTLFIKNYPLARKGWYGAGLVLMLIALILTSSRGAWLAVMAALAVLFMRRQGISLKKWGAAAAVILIMVSPLIFTRFKLVFHDGSSSERIELYKAAVNKIVDNPLLGNGLYGFRQTLEKSDYSGEVLNYPHNIILNFWLETGLLGVLSFAAIIHLALKKYRSKPSVLGFAAAIYLLAMFTHGTVDVPYFKNDLSILFWFMVSVFYIED
jgi:putative inorganic carbon (hco3(-)) transporter